MRAVDLNKQWSGPSNLLGFPYTVSRFSDGPSSCFLGRHRLFWQVPHTLILGWYPLWDSSRAMESLKEPTGGRGAGKGPSWR